jgi:hypothetical protein
MSQSELRPPESVLTQADSRWGRVDLGDDYKSHIDPFLRILKSHLPPQTTGVTLGGNFQTGRDEWEPSMKVLAQGMREATEWPSLHQWELRVSNAEAQGLGPHADSHVYQAKIRAASLALEKTGVIGLWLVHADMLDNAQNRNTLRVKSSYSDPRSARMTLIGENDISYTVRPFHVMDLEPGQIFTSDETDIPWIGEDGIRWSLLHSVGGPIGRKALVGRQLGHTELYVPSGTSA